MRPNACRDAKALLTEPTTVWGILRLIAAKVRERYRYLLHVAVKHLVTNFFLSRGRRAPLPVSCGLVHDYSRSS